MTLHPWWVKIAHMLYFPNLIMAQNFAHLLSDVILTQTISDHDVITIVYDVIMKCESNIIKVVIFVISIFAKKNY